MNGGVTPGFQARVSPCDCLWGKGPASSGLSGQGQLCVSEPQTGPQPHTGSGIPNGASLRSAWAWGWTEDALARFPGDGAWY